MAQSSPLLVLDDGPADLVELAFGREPDRGPDLVELRDSPGHVFEAVAVGLLVGDVLDRALRPRQGDHPAGQVVDGDLLVAPDVEDLPRRPGRSPGAAG